MVKHTQVFVGFYWRIVWVCLTILWGWRWKGQDMENPVEGAFLNTETAARGIL